LKATPRASPPRGAHPPPSARGRLNNCEWAGEQLLALAAKLRSDLPALGALPSAAMSSGVQVCEDACHKLLDYIVAKQVYHELDGALSRLYRPSPSDPAARLAPLLRQLSPILNQIMRKVAPRWSQQLLMGMLTSTSLAIGAVLELPGASFTKEHTPLLHSDIDDLKSFFLDGGVLEEQVVRYSLTFLYSLADEACEPAG
jgi:hypothetical protein